MSESSIERLRSFVYIYLIRRLLPAGRVVSIAGAGTSEHAPASWPVGGGIDLANVAD